jgi:hypothetical protein
MRTELLSDIETGMGDFRLGWLSTRNGRLLERLRAGRRVWPETEAQIRAFMISERQRRTAPDVFGQPERAA